MLMAFCHLHAKSILQANSYRGVLEKKKERKACLAEGERGWRRSWWYREDQHVVGGGNDGGDAVVTVV